MTIAVQVFVKWLFWLNNMLFTTFIQLEIHNMCSLVGYIASCSVSATSGETLFTLYWKCLSRLLILAGDKPILYYQQRHWKGKCKTIHTRKYTACFMYKIKKRKTNKIQRNRRQPLNKGSWLEMAHTKCKHVIASAYPQLTWDSCVTTQHMIKL